MYKSSEALATFIATHSLRQREVAAALGVSRPAVSQRACGRTRVTLGDVRALADKGDTDDLKHAAVHDFAAVLVDLVREDGAEVSEAAAVAFVSELVG